MADDDTLRLAFEFDSQLFEEDWMRGVSNDLWARITMISSEP